MKLEYKIFLILVLFVIFWLAPAFLTTIDLNIKTRNAEQVLEGEKTLWFKHHEKTYGCLAERLTICWGAPLKDLNMDSPEWKWESCINVKDMLCEHKDRYENDKKIQGLLQDIPELR